MANNCRNYAAARGQLITYLEDNGFTPHPNEVYCPSTQYCWVDVAAIKGHDYWAFEYKSHNDSIRRGFHQCRAYAEAFSYVVIVADRARLTSSQYFYDFKRSGFGVWKHHADRFYQVIAPKRQPITPHAQSVVRRQFRRLVAVEQTHSQATLRGWLAEVSPCS